MCRHAYHWEREWGSTITTPRPAPAQPDPDLLISDRDRERVVDLLKQATADGRLTIDEFGDRVDEAYRARTEGDLRAVLRQLPAPAAPVASPRPVVSHHQRRPSFAGPFRPLLMIAVVFAVVAIASGGHVIAAWPLLWLLFFVGRRAWR